ncbi:MAG: tetratricopeptide repeat protein, partial [Desulfovibrio sp.]|nr:tetratricopeptide repeat protein [Desulfovibrio sp.]
EAFKAVLKLDKGSAMDRANLGICYKLLGRREDAQRELTAALELDPTLDFARAHLAELEDGAAGGANDALS